MDGAAAAFALDRPALGPGPPPAALGPGDCAQARKNFSVSHLLDLEEVAAGRLAAPAGAEAREGAAREPSGGSSGSEAAPQDGECGPGGGAGRGNGARGPGSRGRRRGLAGPEERARGRQRCGAPGLPPDPALEGAGAGADPARGAGAPSAPGDGCPAATAELAFRDGVGRGGQGSRRHGALSGP